MTSFGDHIGLVFSKAHDVQGKEDTIFSESQFFELIKSWPAGYFVPARLR